MISIIIFSDDVEDGLGISLVIPDTWKRFLGDSASGAKTAKNSQKVGEAMIFALRDLDFWNLRAILL